MAPYHKLVLTKVVSVVDTVATGPWPRQPISAVRSCATRACTVEDCPVGHFIAELGADAVHPHAKRASWAIGSLASRAAILF